ncbi:50S ribosomal protein L23 [candidate division FCPU426 bacterium]|nr:50S ribosomal protein L23 [candidate division FCPU426 bacterium]
MNSYTVIKRPLITEKTSRDKEKKNSYAFEVDRRANKIEIKQAIEQIFKVHVVDVSTNMMPGKNRRFGTRVKPKQPWKKAIATLKQGERIQVYEGV